MGLDHFCNAFKGKGHPLGFHKARPHAGGGVEGENIIVHVVPLTDLDAFIASKRAEGCGMDVKLLMLLGARMLG